MTKTSESKWRALIRAQERSGQSVREFAASKGFAPGTLYWWRSELRRRDSKLVPVEIVEHESRSGTAEVCGRGFELVVGGLSLRIPHGFDAAELRRLLSALAC